MAPKRLAPLLLSYLVTFASASALQKVEKLPETWCITYLSTYLAPVYTGPSSEATSLSISPIVDDFVSETQGVTLTIPTQDAETSGLETLNPSLPPSLYTSISSSPESSLSFPIDGPLSTSTEGYVFVTTSLPPNVETPTPEPTADPEIPGPGGRAVIFRVIPSSQDTKRTFYRRALGGFVGSQADLCDDAVVFNLFEGRLFDGDSLIYYDGESYKELRGQPGPLPRGAITSTFLDDGGYVQFVSSSLPGGRAGFCQVSSSGQVYLTFGSSPPNCVPVRLAVTGVEECLDEASTSDALSTRTRVTGDVQDITKTSGIPVTTLLEPAFTEPTSIDAPSTEDLPQTNSFPTTSVRFSNSSTASINFPVGPTRSSILSFVTIGTDDNAPTVPTDPILPTSTDVFSSLTDIAPIDNTSTEPVFPPEETSTFEDLTSGSVTDTPTSTTAINNGGDVSSSETDFVFVSETSTISSEVTATTIISVFPVTNPELETTTTMDTTSAIDTEAVSLTETTTADTTTAEITTAPDTTTTADPTTAEPTTTAAEPVFERLCPLAINGIDLFTGETYYDDKVRPINSPFDVGLYGEYGRTLYVSDNGQVTINDASGAWMYANGNLPASQVAPITIFTYWDDMDIDRSLGHQITYEIADNPVDGKVLKIDWCVGSYPREGGYNHWTLSLYERRPGQVMITYDSTAKKGSSATVGVQNRNKGFFKQFSINTPNSVTDKTVIEFLTREDGGTDVYRYYY